MIVAICKHAALLKQRNIPKLLSVSTLTGSHERMKLITLKIEILYKGNYQNIYHVVSCYGLGKRIFFTFSVKLEVMSNN